MLKKFVNFFGGDPNKKIIRSYKETVQQINALEARFEELSDDELRAQTNHFRQRLANGETLDDLMLEAFAAVREVSKRTIGLRHYDVQMIGGIVMHGGQIAEMKTGEGKTLVATLSVYLNALAGRGVHLITVNDYLARRDARWMGPIYHFLGLSVGVLQMAAVTDNGKKAFLYDPHKESSQEDQHELRLVERKEAYQADITYGTNSEFGFDYLRDNMASRLEDRVQRGHFFAIIDEVDNVLIDEARTPLIISGPAQGDLEWYSRMALIVKQLREEDYEVNEKDRNINLTEIGVAHVEQLLGQPLQDPDRPEDVTPEQARLLGYLEQAMRAQYLFKRNKDYLVQAGKVVIVDPFTGRLMPGRRWSDGLHQAVEAKEGAKIEPENITYATVTIQNYFRMYDKLSGMTGTALTEAEEFSQIYKLEVLPIPTNLEYQAQHPESLLVEIPFQEDGNKFFYFARQDDAEKKALFWRRKDYPDVIYRTLEAKQRALVTECVYFHVKGRPLLIGTTSVESSDQLSNRLKSEMIRRLLQVMVIRDVWMEANNREEDGRRIAELQPLHAALETLNPSDLRQFARPLGVSLNLEEPSNMARLLNLLELDAADEARLKAVIQGGVSHQVLNARKHTEESQIIAGAGAFGAVTIATNMAGRGVDIKLGGEIAEEVLAAVTRILKRTGYEDPYDMTPDAQRRALLEMDPTEFGIYDNEIKFFLQFFEDMEQVHALGGLHVIGSERHEARRIDNQLRGRAARQGDPGSSRFFLSMEDELMRLFGGEQVGNLMQRLNVDDSLPLEVRIVSNIVEQSQHRVEGANFDVRKHLLEYDDVLNAQRERIYKQRERVFTKDDLTDDVLDMLQAEIEDRVPIALADEEGPWRLMAWLDQIQPPFRHADGVYPSFGYRQLLAALEHEADPRTGFLEIARHAVQVEQDHVRRAITALIDRSGMNLTHQLDERQEALETFMDGLDDDEESEAKRPQQILDELSSVVRMSLKLSNDQLRSLANDPLSVQAALQEQIEDALVGLAVQRLVATVEYRLGGESLELDRNTLQELSWDEAMDRVVDGMDAILSRRVERLAGDEGQLVRDLEMLLDGRDLKSLNETDRINILVSLTQGTRTLFDQKTHKQLKQTYARFSYVYYAAQLISACTGEQVQQAVLAHLRSAQKFLSKSWGESELMRIQQADPARAAQLLEDDALAREKLARSAQTDIYRHTLLGAISEAWVEYLTRVDALRVSIGLEAYAQRDPLTQYKSKASGMFQELLAEIRTGVVSRIFLYQPRVLAVVEQNAQLAVQPVSSTRMQSQAEKPRKKKRRKR